MKKKTIIIIAISIIVLLIVIGLICFFVSRANNSESGDAGNSAQESKTIKIYNQLKESEKYQFTRKVNDENQVTIAKSGDRAYEEETFNGKKTYYVVNEGDLYLLNKSTERYYKYQNNHENTEIRNAVEATTETEGYTGDIYCLDCDKLVKEGEVIPVLEPEDPEEEEPGEVKPEEPTEDDTTKPVPDDDKEEIFDEEEIIFRLLR